MKILIDADGCPVVERAVQAAKEFHLECIMVCDTSHIYNSDYAKVVTVSKGADSADFILINMVQKDDITVTQDYGLAAMCLVRGGKAINQNGQLYTNENIDSLLSVRYASKKLRRAGERVKGPSKRTHQQNINFDRQFRQLIQSVLPS